MPEKDYYAGELDQAHIVFDVIFISDHQSTEIVEPSEQALDFPPALETAQGATVLSLALGATALAMRRNHFSTEAAEHFLIERIAGSALPSPFGTHVARTVDRPDRTEDNLRVADPAKLPACGEKHCIGQLNFTPDLDLIINIC
jgi:hypothetical protein